MINDTQKDYTRRALEQTTVKILTNPGDFKGTGFFINHDGYILTAWHCLVSDIDCGATISVETIAGKTFDAQLAQDKSIQASDIAILKIDYTTEHCVPLGLITEQHCGDEVIAIGYPAGYIEGQSIGVDDGIINQLLNKTTIDAFETTAIEGQSNRLIYHLATQRLIGLEKEIYFNEVTKTTGLAASFESLFAKWPDLERINKRVAHAWDERMALMSKPLDAAPLPVQTALQDLRNRPQRVKSLCEGFAYELPATEKQMIDIQQAESHFHQHQATALPKFLEDRLAIVKEEAKDKFKPLALLDALLWCLSLIQKSITVNELQGAIQALRQQKLFTDLPKVSNQQIEDGLSRLGGFVRSLTVGFEKRWQLQHEILGQWFCEQLIQVEDFPSLRLSLVPFGAVPLPETASEAEFGQWLEWIKEEYDEHFDCLLPELQVSVHESLLAHLPEKSSDHALILADLVFVFLSGTGEQQRGFALESVLEQALQYHLPITTQAEVLVSLGDIQQALNKPDNALEYYERFLALREQLLSESNTSQNCREVGIAFERIGNVYISQKQFDQALEYFERSLSFFEQLLSESATLQNRRYVAIALARIGDIYVSQNQSDKALEYFERSLSFRLQSLLYDRDNLSKQDLTD